MNQTRKMWASAAAVGVILVGGATVAAAASAGRVEQARAETQAKIRESAPKPTPTPTSTDGFVVSEEINPDPGKVLDYWTEQRMESAEPMPMPEVEVGPADSFELAE
ncbi:hypothetical protein [Nonomuraea typhae]|uniref:hypothetical protein n=1 Tax=Nonomuraea typhae TaxID=2603600 RepID=UPI0012FC9118|nr:hypothetical protein [Nonomuraea typhae]